MNVTDPRNDPDGEAGQDPDLDGLLGDASPWRIRFNTIYTDLRRKIILLRYPPGTRLDVDMLAAEHAVSRTPIRTVIRRLENEGLAITRHGVGTIVTEIDLAQVREAMLLRMHLAELVGKLSPRLPRDGVVAQLENSLHEFGKARGVLSPQAFARTDMGLHDSKCGLIGNQPLRRIYDEMYYRTVRVWFFFLPRMDWPTEHAALSEDIEQTIRAIRRGDIAGVGYVTRNSISAGVYRLSDLIANPERQ